MLSWMSLVSRCRVCGGAVSPVGVSFVCGVAVTRADIESGLAEEIRRRGLLLMAVEQARCDAARARECL